MSSSNNAPVPDDRTESTPTAPASTSQEARAPHALVVKLVKWRTAKGWTQEETANHLAIPLNTLRGYECGNRNPGGANTEKILALIGLLKK
jgi:DNA-binding transcriptional regulator YiaG